MREDLIKLKRVWDLELRRLGLIDATKREFLSSEEGDWTDSMDIEALADSKFNKDRSKPNGSSIAFVVELGEFRVLLAGDAYAPVLRDSLYQMAREKGEERLRLDAFKLPHHGSAKNLDVELLRSIDCADYLFSTNGDRFHHPDHKAVARILKYGRQVASKKIRLWFNYRSEDNEIWDDEDLKKRYNYETCYPMNNKDQLVVIR